MKDDEDEDDVEGLAEAAAGAGAEGGAEEGEGEEEDGPRIGHIAADSATSDEPEADVVGDPAEVDYVELAKIHNVKDIHEGRLVKGILESFHIPCVIEGDVTDTLQGMLPAALDGIDVFVPASFAAKAKLVLCERNIVCGIDSKRLQELLEEGRLARAEKGDAAAREEVLRPLSEETRDHRHEALQRIGRRGREGLELVRALTRDAIRLDGESPLVLDVATIADHGAFGKHWNLLFADDLAKLGKEAEARVRKRAAQALGRLRGAGAAPILVGLLSDDDAEVRDEALESLYALSGGETFDFDPALSAEGQPEAVAAWRGWLRDNPGA